MASIFNRLLDLQELDTHLEQLHHRKQHLPQRAELRSIGGAVAAIDQRIEPVKQRRTELGIHERRLEDEATTLDAKAQSEDKRLYSGKVTSPRELQAIQEEIDSLRR